MEEEKKGVEAGEEVKKEAEVVKKEEVPVFRVHKQDFAKDTVYLYQFSRTPLLPSLSPYCLKVETWIRLTEIKYEVSRVGRSSGIDLRTEAVMLM